MAYGLEIRDASNNLIMDNASRLLYYLGLVNITLTAAQTGNITVTGLTLDGSWVAWGDNTYFIITLASGIVSVYNSNRNTSSTGNIYLGRQ